jgi:hypothetical protein
LTHIHRTAARHGVEVCLVLPALVDFFKRLSSFSREFESRYFVRFLVKTYTVLRFVGTTTSPGSGLTETLGAEYRVSLEMGIKDWFDLQELGFVGDIWGLEIASVRSVQPTK